MFEGEKKFVWVDLDEKLHEYDPESGEGPVLEDCNDSVLIAASDAAEVRDSGVVRAYFGSDKHWHLDGKLVYEERKKLGLWHNREERDLWKEEG